MRISCPYCHSDDVTRVIQNQNASGASNGSAFSSSASFASIGASLSKSLPVPISPLIGGIAGMVVGGLLGSLFDDASQKQTPNYQYFHCEDCGRNFQ